MKKEGRFYVCEACGLSVEPWELQKATQRARKETEQLLDMIGSDSRKKDTRDKKRKEYLNWYLKKGFE